MPAAVKVKIVELFQRSVTAGRLFNANVQLCMDMWFGAVTSPKLKLAALRFATWVFQVGDAAALAKVAQLFLQGKPQ